MYKNNYFEKRSLRLSIIGSIILLALVLISFTRIIDARSCEMLKRNILDSNKRYIESAGNTIDSQIKYIHSLLYKYMNDKSVQKLNFEDFSYESKAKLINQLTQFISWDVNETSTLFDIIISFKKLNYVITKDGQFSKEFFKERYVFDSYKYWLYNNSNIMTTIGREITSLKTAYNKDKIEVIVFYFVSEDYRISVLVDASKLKQWITNSNYYRENSIIVFDNNNRIILKVNVGKSFETNLKNILNTEGVSSDVLNNDNFTVNKERYISSFIESENTGWKYSILYPYAVIESQIASISSLFKLTYLVFIAFCILMGFYYKKKILQPLKLLMKDFSITKTTETTKTAKTTETTKTAETAKTAETTSIARTAETAETTKTTKNKNNKNEFFILKNRLEELKHDNEVFYDFVQDNKKIIRQKLLESLIFNATYIEENDIKEYFGNLCHDSYVLIEFKYGENQLIFKNILKDIFNINTKEYYIAYETVIENGHNTLIVLNYSINLPDILALVSKELELLNRSGKNVICHVSSAVSNLNGLMYATNELITIRELRNVKNEGLVFSINDIISNTEFAGLFNGLEDKVYKALSEGNTNKLAGLLRNISIKNASYSLTDLNQVFTLMENIIKKVEMLKNPELEEISRAYIVPDIDHFDNRSVLLDKEEKLHKHLCFLADVINNSVSPNQDEIIIYIRDNFKNSISLDKVAEHFSMNPTYLSSYVKKLLGISYIEFITNLRIEFAKESIINNDKTISKIAEELGFDNTSSFIRLFKKVVGYTPGVFKKNVEQTLAEASIRD